MKKLINLYHYLMLVICIVVVPILINIAFKYDFGAEWLRSEWTAGEALTFYGSLIGSAITLIGVIMTLNYQSKETKKDNAIKYKPILELDSVNREKKITCPMRDVELTIPFKFANEDSEVEMKADDFLNLLEKNKQSFSLLFKNKGRGETYKAILEEFHVKEVNWDKDINLYSKYTDSQYVGEILQGNYFKVLVNLPQYLFISEKLDNHKWYELSTELNINYSDMFNIVKYQYSLFLIFKVIIEDDNIEQPYFYKAGFKFVKVNYSLEDILPHKKILSEEEKEDIEYRE